MAARYLLDTNVLVYALDGRYPAKRGRAVEVIRRAGTAGSAALPAQVLAEFSSACLKKLRPSPAAEDVRLEAERLLLAFPVLPLTGPVVLEALRGVGEYRFSYYDAQIWALARLNQVGTILSEDFNPGSVIEGVSFVDPFHARFDPSQLV